MNSLLNDAARMLYPTDLRKVFHALGGRQREFVWLLTDLVLGGYQLGQPTLVDPEDVLMLTGDALTELVEAHHIQFIRGVLSGFVPGKEPDLEQLAIRPYADGNTALWKPDVQIQYPTAQVEIVCFDSSLTMLLSRDVDLSQRFRAYFPEAVDLNEYNRHIAARLG